MNYRHAFHAGNHADVFKHVVLLACLAALRGKDKPFAVLDTHAGIGLYDLESDEAQRSPEWRGGIARLWAHASEHALIEAYLACVRAHNPDGVLRAYPGSPALIRDRLRPGDRLIACELHQADAALLKHRFARDAAVQAHHRDGYQAARALTPFPEKRGLILIDPPFESDMEFDMGVSCISDVLQRFRQAMIMWWRPLKDARTLDAIDRATEAFGVERVRLDLSLAPPRAEGKLTASSLLMFNPPFSVVSEGPAIAKILHARLALSL
jgi:23S rRNA (adenine2030-N6)-methyltransferase